MNPTTISTFRSFRVPTPEVWLHLTRPELLARWLGQADLELAPDGALGVDTWNGDSVRGRVLAFAPPVRLELAWRTTPLSPDHHVVLRLEGDGPGSRLTVTQDGLASEAERRVARQTWREALAALRSAIHEGRDAREWGAAIPVAVRTAVPRSAADLWPLFSTPSGLEKWIAHVDRFEGTVGGTFRFASRFQGREVVEEGRVEEMIPESRVALSWEWIGEGWGAPTRVEFTLEPDGSGSTVLILHTGFDKLAPERQVAARRNYAGAWQEVLADLKRLVAPVAV